MLLRKLFDIGRSELIMNKNEEFLGLAVKLGVMSQQTPLGDRTRELQKQLIVWSILITMLTIGGMSVTELSVGGVKIELYKSGWLYLLMALAQGYVLLLFVFESWSDLKKYSYTHFVFLQEFKGLLEKAYSENETVQNAFAESVDTAVEHGKFLNSYGIGADDSHFVEYQKLLGQLISDGGKIVQAQTKVLKELSSSFRIRYGVARTLEVLIPVAMGSISFVLIIYFGQWSW